MESIHNDIQSILIWTLIISIVLITGAVMVSRIRERRRAVKRAALVRSIAAHPAGKGRPQPTMERTRHIDRPGYDWTSATL